MRSLLQSGSKIRCTRSANNGVRFTSVEVNLTPLLGLRRVGSGAALRSTKADHSRKISHAATTIRPKPAQWFHFSGWSRNQAENPANTSRVITSCMPLSCGAE
jgi:hypothetical protein